MSANRTRSVLVLILALAVGYFAGRAGPGSGEAVAAPATVVSQSLPVVTSGDNENFLVVWRMEGGVPSEATRYSLHSGALNAERFAPATPK